MRPSPPSTRRCLLLTALPRAGLAGNSYFVGSGEIADCRPCAASTSVIGLSKDMPEDDGSYLLCVVDVPP